MPQPSRAERRRQQRGGAAPPPRRDPMRSVYIGIGVALVALIVAFVIFNWWQNRTVQQAYATPTPGPNASAKAIQLTNGESLGAKFSRAKYPDTAQGGRGQTVDGIACGSQEYATLHVHTHLAIFYNGKQMQVPQFIGFAPSLARRLSLLDSHARCQRHHSHRSARHQPAARWPLHAWNALRHLGSAVAERQRRRLRRPGHRVRQRRKVRRRSARDTAGRASADRTRSRNAARSAAELHLSAGSLAQNLFDRSA